MKIGMLWFDSDPKAGLAEKVERAAAYYHSKYGKIPTVCFVHPSMLPSNGKKPPEEIEEAEPTPSSNFPAGIEVRSNPHVRPNHFWIGVNGIK